jgi:hypothetical protein
MILFSDFKRHGQLLLAHACSTTDKKYLSVPPDGWRYDDRRRVWFGAKDSAK